MIGGNRAQSYAWVSAYFGFLDNRVNKDVFRYCTPPPTRASRRARGFMHYEVLTALLHHSRGADWQFSPVSPNKNVHAACVLSDVHLTFGIKILLLERLLRPFWLIQKNEKKDYRSPIQKFNNILILCTNLLIDLSPGPMGLN